MGGLVAWELGAGAWGLGPGAWELGAGSWAWGLGLGAWEPEPEPEPEPGAGRSIGRCCVWQLTRTAVCDLFRSRPREASPVAAHFIVAPVKSYKFERAERKKSHTLRPRLR